MARYSYELLASQAWEQGYDGTFTAISANEGYYLWGTGSRWRWTTSARWIEVEAFTATMSGRNIGIRVADGTTVRAYRGAIPEVGTISTIRMLLPPGVNKTVELFVPGHHASAAGGAPGGCFPIRVHFNLTATVITPVSTTNRLFVLGDSISAGGNASDEALLGWGGLAKRGLTCQVGTTPWKGAYNAGTTYALGDLVSSGKFIWRSLQAANTGNTPANGSAFWQEYGYNGTVTLWRTWGFKRVTDDWSTPSNRTTYAAALAAANPTQIVILLGTNDWLVAGPSLANFTAYYEGMLDAINAVLPSVPIYCVRPLITTGREGANFLGITMDQFRSAISSAVSARSGWAVPPVDIDGKAILVTGDLQDGLHPSTSGHEKLFRAIMGNIA